MKKQKDKFFQVSELTGAYYERLAGTGVGVTRSLTLVGFFKYKPTR